MRDSIRWTRVLCRMTPSLKRWTFLTSPITALEASLSRAGSCCRKALPENCPAWWNILATAAGAACQLNWLVWPTAGYAHFVMDTRGQGSGWMPGDTPDWESDGLSPQFPGFMTRGILSPHTYYYRRVFTDAVRAVEAARSHPAVDAQRIAITGGSQGGGITLAVAGLEPGVQAALPDVPFLCHYKRATTLVNSYPYAEIASYCKTHRDKIDAVFSTLSYFDGMNFAPRAQARALFSTALMDNTCPPSTVFAAYNHYAGQKDIRVYEYNQHEGGGIFQAVEKIRFLKAFWK